MADKASETNWAGWALVAVVLAGLTLCHDDTPTKAQVEEAQNAADGAADDAAKLDERLKKVEDDVEALKQKTNTP